MTTYSALNLPSGIDLLNRRVKIVDTFSGYTVEEKERIVGRTGVCQWNTPDSDGDIFVNLDDSAGLGRFYVYTREWEFLDGPEAAPEAAPEAKPEPTPAEETLERLIQAIYATAKSHGYTSLLADLFKDAGIPLRDSERRLIIRAQRVVGLSNNTEVRAALESHRRQGATGEVELVRTFAEFTVSVPWPETGEHRNCSEVERSIGEDFEQIPDEVLQQAALSVGLTGDANSMRTWLSNQTKVYSQYGIALACNFCG